MSAQPGSRVPVIRDMQPRDLDAIALIEARTYSFPWGRGIFSDCLMAGYFCIVLDSDEGLLGYAIVSSAAAEAHILNLCVDVDAHRQGYGQQLLDCVIEYALDARIRRMFLEVRPSNQAAIALYINSGFSKLGVRKGYYKAAEGREDALVLVREFESEL